MSGFSRSLRRLFFSLFLAPVCLAGRARGEDLKVHTDFPGGAAQVVDIDQKDRKISFRIPVQKNGGWQSWWYFKVSGIDPGETVGMELSNGVAHAKRAVFSTDGKNWKYTAPTLPLQQGAKNHSSYAQKIDAKEAWFAWYIPYLPADAEALADRAEKTCKFAKRFELCKSEKGIPVVGIAIEEPGVPESERVGIWIQARQHAWETGGSWVAHFLVEWLISDDPRAQALRKKARIFIIPIMDVDSVFLGMGGKNQKPHDHNRDWTKMPIWNAVKAAMGRVKQMDAARRLDMFLDLHDPGWSGAFDFWCHVYNEMGPVRRKHTDLFMLAAKTEITGPLRCTGKVVDSYPITTPTSGIWVGLNTHETVVAGTFEIGVGPPAGFKGNPPEQHRIAGRQLGLAIERYFRENELRP